MTDADIELCDDADAAPRRYRRRFSDALALTRNDRCCMCTIADLRRFALSQSLASQIPIIEHTSTTPGSWCADINNKLTPLVILFYYCLFVGFITLKHII